jgi:hypothetical protein
MEATEQAKQMVDKYFRIIDRNTTAPFEVKLDVAEACALIAVDEIIKATIDDWSHSDYWQSVKNEIINL